jgi:hypothetical protein
VFEWARHISIDEANGRGGTDARVTAGRQIDWYNRAMCRNIKTLANFEPPATDEEIRASALQFVRKLSGSSRPSKANEDVFNRAVDEVTEVAERLIRSLTTTAPPRNREIEAEKAKERARQRYA